MNLQKLVSKIVKVLINDEQMFSSLDVGNIIKKKFPNISYKDVRSEVRKLWSTEIENTDYDRTIISMELDSDKCVEVLVYHSVNAGYNISEFYYNNRPILEKYSDLL